MKRFVLMLAVAIWIPAGFYSCDKVEKPEEIVPVESVKLDQTRLDLTEGESKYLTATVSPLSRHRQTSDLGKLRPIIFDPSFNAYRVVGEIVGKAFSDGLKLK